MSFERTIRALFADASKTAECQAARIAWARRTSAAWLKAHHEMDDRLGEAVEQLSEEEFERMCDAEEAKVDAMMAQLRAAIDEDKWPPELYFSGI